MTDDAKTFTQADIDALKDEHSKAIADLNGRHKEELDRKVEAAIKKAQAEAEEAARKANMSELEKAQSDLADLQAKYQISQDTIALTTQKDDTRKKMTELGVDEKYLKYVFVGFHPTYKLFYAKMDTECTQKFLANIFVWFYKFRF